MNLVMDEAGASSAYAVHSNIVTFIVSQ